MKGKEKFIAIILLVLVLLPFVAAAPTSVPTTKCDSEPARITKKRLRSESRTSLGINSRFLTTKHFTIAVPSFTGRHHSPVEARKIDVRTLLIRISDGGTNRDRLRTTHLAATSPILTRASPGFRFPPGGFWAKFAMSVSVLVALLAVVGLVRMFIRWLQGGCECWCCRDRAVHDERAVDEDRTESEEQVGGYGRAGNDDPIRNWNSNVEMVGAL
jgi:hypothetical protein